MFLVTNENMGLCLCIIEVDCSLGQFESAKLKDKELTKTRESVKTKHQQKLFEELIFF